MSNKIAIIVLALIVCCLLPFYGQTGCTDKLALNYNPYAIQNDGSCMYGAQTISITKSYPMDDILSETSGLIFWDGMLWTHNDNDDSIIYKLGPNDGSISGNISLAPQINMDWDRKSVV